MEEVKKKLIDFLKENFIMPENFSEEDSFLEKGIIDSTGVIELVTFNYPRKFRFNKKYN
ncbi:MAG: hypothetical protein ACTSRH_18800 [Promethearchaeota archaeon]